jgi:formate-dependent nitrite reductase membrane component NrfD
MCRDQGDGGLTKSFLCLAIIHIVVMKFIVISAFTSGDALEGAEANNVLAAGEVGDGGGAYYCGVVAGLGVGSLKAKVIAENIIS